MERKPVALLRILRIAERKTLLALSALSRVRYAKLSAAECREGGLSEGEMGRLADALGLPSRCRSLLLKAAPSAIKLARSLQRQPKARS